MEKPLLHIAKPEVTGMSDAELDRVRRDLETIKDAAAAELPFGREEVKRTVLHGLLAVPLAIWATVGPGTYMSVAIIATLIAIVIAGSTLGAKCRRQRFEHPSRWRECRYTILGLLVGGPLGLFGIFWLVANGTPPKTMMGLALLAPGIGFCLVAVFSSRRRSYCGMGAAMVACGAAMPYCSDRQIGLAIALLFIVGASTAAAIQTWQLKRSEGNHGTD